MKTKTLIGLSILSVFLLCSLSYQPIIAEKPIIQTKEDIILVESEDCGCVQITNNDPPFFLWFICIPLLFMMIFFSAFVDPLFLGPWFERNFPELFDIIDDIKVNLNYFGYRIGCGDLNWP